jgi:hypothetical protein
MQILLIPRQKEQQIPSKKEKENRNLCACESRSITSRCLFEFDESFSRNGLSGNMAIWMLSMSLKKEGSYKCNCEYRTCSL